MVEIDDEKTEVDAVCPSCRSQAIAVTIAAEHDLVITFVVVGAEEPKWSCFARLYGTHRIVGVGRGGTQEDALAEVLAHLREHGLVP